MNVFAVQVNIIMSHDEYYSRLGRMFDAFQEGLLQRKLLVRCYLLIYTYIYILNMLTISCIL